MTAAVATNAAAQAELAGRILSRRRLLPFVHRMNPKYMAGWVHEDICRRLERFSDDVAKGLSPRLMLLMPPRHGKSELASKMFPPWHMGRHPDHEIIACSYNISLAMGFSKKIKAIFDDPAYQTVFEARLDPENRSTEEWGIAGTGGGYVAAGVGGGITGKGAHILVIDDPIKNAEEADSLNTREGIWDWYGSTAYTRLAPGAGVLVIQCMVGSTRVRLPDGSEKRLDCLRAGEKIATFEGGRLTTSTVSAWKRSGEDSILKITTTSGKIVRANGRHPFMVSTDEGLKWIRARSLTTASRIVVVKDSGASGAEKPAQPLAARCLPSAVASAPLTTASRNGLTATDHPRSTPSRSAPPTSSTATDLPRTTTPDYSRRKTAGVLSAVMFLLGAAPAIGATPSVSIIVTPPAAYGRSCVMIATPQSDTFALNESLSPSLPTCDFTTDQIVSIELDGVEEVFDVQVARTGNFIANGVVSHNTWWHDDDLAGRLQQAMAAGAGDEDVDQFEIIKYPAIAEAAEFLDTLTDNIIRVDCDATCVEDLTPMQQLGLNVGHLQFLRAKGAPLHEARYDIKKLRRIMATIAKRFWSALYQQNPVPDDGAFFTRDMFKRAKLPHKRDCNVAITWDFAIGIKKKNDFTVGTVSLQDTDDMLHFAEQIVLKTNDTDALCETILDQAQRWYNTSLILGFEDGQIWKTLESTLRKKCAERKFYPNIKVLPPLTDKEVRATPLQARMQHGKVSWCDQADWYENCRNELLRFPAGVHDDRVDSCAWNAQVVVGRTPPQKKKDPKQKSWRDKLAALATSGSGSHMAA